MKTGFDKVRYKWFENPKLEGENYEMLEVVTDIVDFSLPQIETRIEHGNRIYKNTIKFFGNLKKMYYITTCLKPYTK